MKFAIVFAVLLCISMELAHGQTGSVREGMQAQRDAMMRKALNNQDFEESKKIRNNQPSRKDERITEGRLNLSTAKTGDVGRISSYKSKIIQVQNKKEALLQVNETHLYWFTGDLAGIVDSDKVRVIGLVKVGKTKTYSSNAGPKTVFELALLSKAEAEKQLEKARIAKQHAEFPMWRSTAGTTVRAKFVRYAGGAVQLLTIDGRTLKCELSDFVNEDADKLRTLIKTSKK